MRTFSYKKPSLNPLVILGFILILGSCSSNKSTQQTAATNQNTQTQQLVVKSSHGTHTIEPTVVSYAADDSQAVVDGEQPAAFDDPLEFINRPIFAFNDKLFEYVLIPASKVYLAIVPTPVNQGVSNFFANIREPLNALNQLLQGEGISSGKSIGRFLINSTIGVLGLFDPATAWFEIDENVSTINDTLASYDVGYGSYLVIPILGQSDLRNGFSTLTESIISPIGQISNDPQTLYIQTYDGFHAFTPQAESYQTLSSQADDPYIFFRNLYMQSVLRDQQYQDKTNTAETNSDTSDSNSPMESE
ncbi:VacJ family lipoprotein [Paraglaciecola sp. L3A3]|uniref:MlaA family lipoprotein n=1 Tax=Paraglaciecola sp. L3A3 TaxID=2686358 RepID=UPI00131D4CA6|nr:VacJ family lipoprotein [Paraglaciecola sp. L3A3]